MYFISKINHNIKYGNLFSNIKNLKTSLKNVKSISTNLGHHQYLQKHKDIINLGKNSRRNSIKMSYSIKIDRFRSIRFSGSDCHNISAQVISKLNHPLSREKTMLKSTICKQKTSTLNSEYSRHPTQIEEGCQANHDLLRYNQ